jgi:predicted kinase
VRRGFIRDCHGDLHLDHVVILDGIMLMDCIEFNDRFRYSDTAADLGFLLMDLDFQGYPAIGDRIARRYARSSGDEEILKLLGFYKSYRAFVRGKVMGFTLDEEEVCQQEKESAAQTAGQYFKLSLASLQPPPPPTLIIVAGLTGSGKSFLATRLGTRIGTEPIRSDLVRKEIMGVPSLEHRLDKYGEGIYTPYTTELTYGALLDRARRSIERGDSVILDASFARFEDRMQAREAATRAGARFRLIECTAPDEIVHRRLRDRITRSDEPSDGRWEIFLEQKKRFDPIGPEEREYARIWDSTTDVKSFLACFVRSLLG